MMLSVRDYLTRGQVYGYNEVDAVCDRMAPKVRAQV